MTIAASSTGPGELIWLVVFAAIEILSIYFSAKIGRKKGYNAVLFGFLGFFFGLIMLVIVMVMPYRSKKGAAAGTTGAPA